MIDRNVRRNDQVLLLGVLALVLIALGIVVAEATGLFDDEPDRLVAPTALPTPLTTATPPPAAVATPPPTAPAAPVVCLDPGHGGLDLGNIRFENDQLVLQEKDLTLEHALLIADRLRTAGVDVVMTRTTDAEANATNADVNGDGVVASPDVRANSDELDDQQARVLTCNAAGADLLVSIHYNGAENTALAGYEVWVNPDRPFSADSMRFAELIHQQLGQQFAAAGYEANDRGIGYEAHAVTGPARPGKLIPSEMPGAVIEGLFLSNDADAAFVVTDAARNAIVSAYETAILSYFGLSGAPPV